MKILYFDCPTGLSGNMILASLIEAGLSMELLNEELRKLPLNNYIIKTKLIKKNGIAATHLEVIITQPEKTHRNLSEILSIIDNSALDYKVKRKITLIFKALAGAEAKVHNCYIDDVHFHEVGAIDSIIDIVGTVIGLNILEIDNIVASPLPLGNGLVKCQHGFLPVPAPATLELMKGLAVKETILEGELVTPTGAAIISTLVKQFGPIPSMKIINIGQGAGSHNLPVPNILRAIIGVTEEFIQEQSICIIETNIDDMNPEIYTYLLERLFKLGALDCAIIPVIMKKGRPANILQVISPENLVSYISEIILTETSSLGVRIRHEKRLVLQRDLISIATKFGQIRVKIGILNNKIVNLAPEFEDCKIIALNNSIPIKEVYQIALNEAKKKIT